MIEEKQKSTIPISQILIKAFKTLSNPSPTKQQIAQCHQNISLTMKDINFLQICISLIRESSSDVLIKLILTTISTYLKHQQSRSNLITRVDPCIINKLLLKTFVDNQINQKYRKMMLRNYTLFIFGLGMQTIRTQTIQQLVNLFKTLQLKINKETSQIFQLPETKIVKSYMNVTLAILKGPTQPQNIRKILNSCFSIVQLLLQKALDLIQESITLKNQQKFMTCTQIVENIFQFYKQLVLALNKDSLLYLRQQILNSKNIQTIIKRILCLSIQGTQSPSRLFYPQNGNISLERLNLIKKYCLQIINFVSKQMSLLKSSKNKQKQKQYLPSMAILQFFISNFPQIIVYDFQLLNFPQNSLPYSQQLRLSLQIMANIIRINQFYIKGQQIKNPLLFRLCFPLLIPQNIQQMSAEQFKSKKQDLLNLHNAESAQNAACKLIQAFADKIDGTVMFLFTQMNALISFQLTANPNYFKQLSPDLIDSPLFKKSLQEQIQVGLSVFALLSYMSQQRQQLTQYIESIFLIHKQYFLRINHPGKYSAVFIICYSYYINNFYQQILSQKENSNNSINTISISKQQRKLFHLQVLQYCCVLIKEFTGKQWSQFSKSERIDRQIAARQGLDCLSNALTQRTFVKALFQAQNQYILFLNIFQFLIFELRYKLNIQSIDIMIQFFIQSIKTQCNYGFKIARYVYQINNIHPIINQLCKLLQKQLFKIINDKNIPNYTLFRTKMYQLIETAVTCSSNPQQFLNKQYFQVQNDRNSISDLIDPISVYLRRLVNYGFSSKDVEALNNIVIFCGNHIKQLLFQQCQQMFGVFINLILTKQESIFKYISSSILQLLKQQQQSSNYNEQLERVLQKLCYLIMLLVNYCYNKENDQIWQQFIINIHAELVKRTANQFLVGGRHSAYLGKLLVTCVMWLRVTPIEIDSSFSSFIYRLAVVSPDYYKSSTQKQFLSSALINLMSSIPYITQDNKDFINAFRIITILLHSSTIKIQQQDDDDQSEQTLQDRLNYKTYTIHDNQHTKSSKSQTYIFMFKNLCHNLRQQSPQFIKICVSNLSQPLADFIKGKVFFFQGDIPNQGLRKLVKIRKNDI